MQVRLFKLIKVRCTNFFLLLSLLTITYNELKKLVNPRQLKPLSVLDRLV